MRIAAGVVEQMLVMCGLLDGRCAQRVAHFPLLSVLGHAGDEFGQGRGLAVRPGLGYVVNEAGCGNRAGGDKECRLQTRGCQFCVVGCQRLRLREVPLWTLRRVLVRGASNGSLWRRIASSVGPWAVTGVRCTRPAGGPTASSCRAGFLSARRAGARFRSFRRRSLDSLLHLA